MSATITSQPSLTRLSFRCDNRFTIYKVHKASKKKREKSSAKRERKATKTLAIVLGMCWMLCSRTTRTTDNGGRLIPPNTVRRRVPVLLGAVLHVQHAGRPVHQAGEAGLQSGHQHVHLHHVAGLHEQLRESGHLHHLQSGVPEGVQEDHAHQIISASYRRRPNHGRHRATVHVGFMIYITTL